MADDDTDAGAYADRVRAKASEASRQLRDEAEHRSENAKTAVADELSSVASALSKASREFPDGAVEARAFSEVADGLSSASDSLRERKVGELATEVTGFARRNPGVFFGGLALLGFAASRFAVASQTDTGGASQPHRGGELPAPERAPNRGPAPLPGASTPGGPATHTGENDR